MPGSSPGMTGREAAPLVSDAHALGREGDVGRLLDAVEDQDGADRERSRRDASNDESLHGADPCATSPRLICAMIRQMPTACDKYKPQDGDQALKRRIAAPQCAPPWRRLPGR